MRAIELNGVQVDNNKAAFEWGRRCAHDLAAVQALFAAQQVIQFVKKPSLDEMVARRVDFLTGYQDAAYARATRPSSTRCARPSAAGQGTAPERGRGALPVQADGLQGRVRGGAAAHRPGLRAEDRAMFEGDYKLVHHLAPPLLAKKNAKGELVKQPFGPWMRSAFGCWRS
jgi:indolepyruvate ferredoxin oxidoreductase